MSVQHTVLSKDGKGAKLDSQQLWKKKPFPSFLLFKNHHYFTLEFAIILNVLIRFPEGTRQMSIQAEPLTNPSPFLLFTPLLLLLPPKRETGKSIPPVCESRKAAMSQSKDGATLNCLLLLLPSLSPPNRRI